ncbi:tripartite tricarboxylate transporter substrate binding protein [Roseomonas sp. SSH11]|uniref:Tripartite tricarboxylate transporter substrate binding protein n=1 Tax=Pararoseomonas baculiformis TaxID=2820812 RepID=A0ABS4AIX1_9PROT|nr:tripartite tricarboxylate transporter substrate binding protein [Pararoseomonas baculiformis]MBP0446470.1 tripartite tricarboxylate transporter substrate binding protein [Pararoseomonas baculiformis]
MMNRRTLMVGIAAAIPAATARAQAPYPDRPVQMIVAYPPGGGTDIAARTLAQFMERELGQPVVVLNRAGAGGEIGFGELSRARPDGYTIGFLNTPNIVTMPIERRTAYKLDDIAPIANLVDDPGAFFVLKDSPHRNLAELIAFAKANPEKVTYATTGIGSDDHLAALAFSRAAGIQMTHVPYNGAAQTRNALLTRQVTLGSINVSEGLADVQQGTARALGQMSEKRWEGLPDVPTFREQGFDVIQSSMRGVGAPAGTPPQILNRLADAIRKVVENPEFRRLATQQSLPLRYLGPDEYKAELTKLRTDFEKLWAQHPWRD